ncbi:MAG: FtsX-like permease family protein [Armatimonadota bacterium]|jgi:ABC-type lipoprotein release transport system permease subunit
MAVALFVAVLTMCDASQRETTRLMRDMGFNVLILPKGTDMGDFWTADFAKEDMPEEYVHRLAESDTVSIRHLVARLQKKITWRKRDVLLTGILPEVGMAHMPKKPPMGASVPRGKVWLGYELAQSMDMGVGDTIDLGDKRFVVEKCLDERGSKDNIRIFAHLHDVQEVLGQPGRINEIRAISCRCEGDRLARVRADLAAALPGTQVTEFTTKAVARAETRRMVEQYAAFVIPAVLVVAAIWIALLTLSNVRQRRAEIGILRAMGVDSGRIAALFLGKAVVVGVLGAGLGFALGTSLALRFGPHVFPLTANKIAPMYSLLPWSLLGAPLLCALASYLPTIVAITQDPAAVLREE